MPAWHKAILGTVSGKLGERGKTGNSGTAIGFVVGAFEREGSGFFGSHAERHGGRVETVGRLLPGENPHTQVVVGWGGVAIY